MSGSGRELRLRLRNLPPGSAEMFSPSLMLDGWKYREMSGWLCGRPSRW